MAGDVHPDDFYRWLDAPPPMLTGVPCVIISKVEHDALRQRASDLELMLRAACCRDTYGWSHSRNLPGEHFFEHTRPCKDADCEAAHMDRQFILQDDGTGLPILTDDARSALLRAVKGG